jgi:hypothetical protein
MDYRPPSDRYPGPSPPVSYERDDRRPTKWDSAPAVDNYPPMRSRDGPPPPNRSYNRGPPVTTEYRPPPPGYDRR